MKPVLTAGLVALAVLASCKAKTGVRASEVEAVLSERASKSAGTPVGADCPGDTLEGTVDCTIHADDGTHATLIIDVDRSAQPPWKARWQNIAFGKLTADDIQRTFDEKYGLRADSISCPAIIVSGGDTQCQARVRTMTIPVNVSTTGSALRYSTSGGGMLRGSEVQAFANDYLAANGGGTATCDFDYRWAVPGEAFTCKSTRGTVVFSIKADGHVGISIDTGPDGKK